MSSIVVISTGKNCPWARQCITSVAMQKHPDFRHIYIAADRRTEAIARSVPVKHAPSIYYSPLEILENVYTAIEALSNDTIAVWLDGDDWLTNQDVLATVDAAYDRDDVWLTYGNFRCSGKPPFYHPYFGSRYPVGVSPRHDVWRASHLKTFRAGLVKKIRPEHLRHPDGRWLSMCTDRAFMYPLLEMAGERYRVFTEALSVYNTQASSLFRKQDPKRQAELQQEELRQLRYIESLPQYEKLKERPW